MKNKKRGWLYYTVFLAAVVCAASWAASNFRNMRDRPGAAQPPAKLKTVCVGRYLIDVPEQAQISTSNERIDGFAIETIKESEAQFRSRLLAREAEINAVAAEAGLNGPSGIVESRDVFNYGMAGRTFIFGRRHTHGFEQGRRIDLAWESVEGHAHTNGLSVSLSADYVEKNDAVAAEALLGRVRLHAQDEVPAEPGFCVSNAVYLDRLPLYKTEHIAMHLELPGRPDLAMTLFSMPGGGSDRSLVERATKTDAVMKADAMLRVSKIRESQRNINNMIGEEVLIRAREFNGTTSYGFSWETAGIDDDPLHPYLSLELQAGMSARGNGRPSDSRLDEDALLNLWDSIASSIRPRQGTAIPPPAARPEIPAHLAQRPSAH